MTLSADGFTPGVTVQVKFGDMDITPTQKNTDSNGYYTASLNIPLGANDGLHTVQVLAPSVQELAQTTVRVDTIAPTVPVGSAIQAKRQITFQWEKVADADIDKYQVFRKLSSELSSAYVMTNEVSSTVSSVVHQLAAQTYPLVIGETYNYMVKSVDRLGNVSVGSTTVTATLLPDTADPVVEYMGGPYGGYYNGNYTLRGQAEFNPTISDDRQATSVTMAYSKDGSTFTSLPATALTYQGTSWSGTYLIRATVMLDTVAISQQELGDGLYTVRLTALDAAGKSSVRTQQFYIDNTPPAAQRHLLRPMEQKCRIYNGAMPTLPM
jgi:hypothetical protein